MCLRDTQLRQVGLHWRATFAELFPFLVDVSSLFETLEIVFVAAVSCKQVATRQVGSMEFELYTPGKK